MKTKVFILLLLTVSLCLAFSHIAHSQFRPRSDGSTIPVTDKKVVAYEITDSTKDLIADETWLTYTKTGAKIVTYSESVFQAISLKWGTEFKAIHIYYKKDRNGPYKEYNILISQEIGNNIKQWSKKNL